MFLCVCVCVCVVLRVRFCILNNNNKIPQSVFSIYCEPKSLHFHLQILQICINYLLPTSLGLYPGLTPNLIVRALVQPFTAIHPKQIISPSKPIMDLVALRRPVWAKPGIPQNWTALSPVPCIGGGGWVFAINTPLHHLGYHAKLGHFTTYLHLAIMCNAFSETANENREVKVVKLPTIQVKVPGCEIASLPGTVKVLKNLLK